MAYETLVYEQEEADGSECEFCGEAIYLSMWRAVVYLGIELDRRRLPSDMVLCDGCNSFLNDDTPD